MLSSRNWHNTVNQLYFNKNVRPKFDPSYFLAYIQSPNPFHSTSKYVASVTTPHFLSSLVEQL